MSNLMECRAAALILLAALAAAGGCGRPASDGGAGSDAGAATDSGAPGLTWTSCGGFECATVDVPADDVDPANGTIGLRILRVPAQNPAERIGTLFVFTGGPGMSGVNEAASIVPGIAIFMPDVAVRFDLVFYDRRGTGASAPLSCIDAAWIDDYRATAPDPAPADWAAVDAIWQRFADGCQASPPPYPLPTLGTETATRDADRIREALGEDTISFFAISYGGLTGGSYATMFPEHVRTGVFDAPVAPYGPTYLDLDWFTQNALATEAVLEAFFADCDLDPACVFHGFEGAGAGAAAYDALATALVAMPLDVGGRPAGAFDLAAAVLSLVTATGGELAAFRDPLAAMLDAAEAGFGDLLLAAADGYFFQYGGVYDLVLNNAYLGIMLGDAPCPAGFDLAAAQAAWPAVAALAPRLGPVIFNGALSCLHWPTPRAAAGVIAPAASPLLVLGGANDLNVSPAGSMLMHAALGPMASFVRWDGYGHVFYGRSPCMAAAANAFLVDPTTWVPPAGGVCPAGT